MPNLAYLYNVQSVVESAAVTVLSGSGITNTFASRNTSSLTTPRVEVQWNNNGFTNHVFLSSSREFFYDCWNGQLNALVITDRAWNNASHSVFTSTVSNVLADNRKFNSGSLMPSHSMLMPKITALQTQIDPDNDFDISIVAIQHQIAIKPESWRY